MGSHNEQSPAKTREQCRDEFWAHTKHLARYWSRLPASAVLAGRVPGRNDDVIDKRFEGFLHSFAVAIAGNAMGLSFPVAIIPDPSPEDGEEHAPAFDRSNDLARDGTFQYDVELGPSLPGEPGWHE